MQKKGDDFFWNLITDIQPEAVRCLCHQYNRPILGLRFILFVASGGGRIYGLIPVSMIVLWLSFNINGLLQQRGFAITILIQMQIQRLGFNIAIFCGAMYLCLMLILYIEVLYQWLMQTPSIEVQYLGLAVVSGPWRYSLNFDVNLGGKVPHSWFVIV